VILAGTNDIAGNTGPMTVEQIEANLVSMAELAKMNKIRVVLASVLPVSNYGTRPARQSARYADQSAARENRAAECLDQEVRGGETATRTSIIFPPWSIRRDCCSRISARTDFILTRGAMR